MKIKILVAGATGYLGSFVVKELAKNGYYIRVLARDKKKVKSILPYVDEVVIGDVKKPDTLIGSCAEMDYVFSSIGITSIKGAKTIRKVDYQGNLYLLREAEKSQVKTFMYIHVLFDEQLQDSILLVKEKANFVEELRKSTLDHVVIKPTAFFSDMTNIFNMARKGVVFLTGTGEKKINPIHGRDLAKYCVKVLPEKNKTLEVGGPRVSSHQEVAELAFQVLDKDPKIRKIPTKVVRVILLLIRIVYPKAHPMAAFMISVLDQNLVAPSYGNTSLDDYYQQLLD